MNKKHSYHMTTYAWWCLLAQTSCNYLCDQSLCIFRLPV